MSVFGGGTLYDCHVGNPGDPDLHLDTEKVFPANGLMFSLTPCVLDMWKAKHDRNIPKNHEETLKLSNESWLFLWGSLQWFMKQSLYNCVGFHPLYHPKQLGVFWSFFITHLGPNPRVWVLKWETSKILKDSLRRGVQKNASKHLNWNG